MPCWSCSATKGIVCHNVPGPTATHRNHQRNSSVSRGGVPFPPAGQRPTLPRATLSQIVVTDTCFSKVVSQQGYSEGTVPYFFASRSAPPNNYNQGHKAAASIWGEGND